LEEAKKGDDPEAIRTKISDMMQSTNELYRIKSEAEKAAAETGSAEAKDDNVVNAEFTEKPAEDKK
jgi:hypothetical protein